MTPWADPARKPRRGNPAAGTAAVFNAVAVGVAGLYAGTGSLWLTCAAGCVAAGLAGVHLVVEHGGFVRRGAAAAAAPERLGPGGAVPKIESAVAGGGGEASLMDDPESQKLFEDFFRTEYPRLVLSVMRLGAGLAEADDVAAEAMLQTLTRWADIADPAAYTHTSARRAYFARATRKVSETPLDEAAMGEKSFLDSLDLKDQERTVNEVLARLPQAQRIVMHLHYAGLPTEEIARQLNVQEATVRSNLRHARERLRKLLSDEDLI